MQVPAPSGRGFRPYTRPKDGPQRPLVGHTLGSWWFNISHYPGSLFRRVWRAVVRPIVGGPTSLGHWWTNLLVAVAIFLAIGGLVALLVINPHRAVEVQGVNHRAVGLPLKEIRLESLNQQGSLVTPNKTAGRVTMLFFWSPEVKESIKCLPKIASIERRFRGQPDFMALVVACPSAAEEAEGTTKEFRTRVLELFSSEGIDLPAYADGDRRTRKAAELAGAFRSRYPTLIVLDGDGKIEGVWTQFDINSGEYAQALIGKLLAF